MSEGVVEFLGRIFGLMFGFLLPWFGWVALSSVFQSYEIVLDDKNYGGLEFSVVAFLMFLFVFGAMFGLLLFYILSARVFSVSRKSMEKVMSNIYRKDPRERIMHKYYNWCLNFAYGKDS